MHQLFDTSGPFKPLLFPITSALIAVRHNQLAAMSQRAGAANEYDDTVELDLGINAGKRFYVGYRSEKEGLAKKCANKYARLVKASGQHGEHFAQDENKIYFPAFVKAKVQKGDVYQLTITGKEGGNLVRSVVPQAGRAVANDNDVYTFQVPKTCTFRELPTAEALAMRSQ